MRVMKTLATVFALILSPLVANAAVVDYSIGVDFYAVKTRHDCTNMGSGEPSTPGTCGRFQTLAFGETYQGSLRLVGQATDGAIDFRSTPVYEFHSYGSGASPFSSSESKIGGENTPIGSYFSFEASDTQAELLLTDGFGAFGNVFSFDFINESGTYWYGDDAFTYATIEFSLDLISASISVDGQPLSLPESLKPVPLPAGMPIFLSGFLVLALIRRRGRYQNVV